MDIIHPLTMRIWTPPTRSTGLKRLSILLAALIISGCATTAKYEAILNSWTGSNINDLVSSWGYPANSFKAPNGNTVYVYSSSGSYTMPTNTASTYNVYGNTVYGNSTTTGGQTLNFWCNTFFEVSESNIITTWRYEGNNCTSSKTVASQPATPAFKPYKPEPLPVNMPSTAEKPSSVTAVKPIEAELPQSLFKAQTSASAEVSIIKSVINLKVLAETDGMYKVETPDGIVGWIGKNRVEE